MGDKSGIQWTDATWNPVTGCSKVSPGCAHCYAETRTKRFAKVWGLPGLPWTPENAAQNVILKPERLDQPLRWRKPRMVFVNSMSDLFHELVPDDYIAQVFAVMALAPQHTFQILTKRPERMREWFAWTDALGNARPTIIRAGHVRNHVDWMLAKMPKADPMLRQFEWPLPNVWLGTTIENRRVVGRADLLRETPAAVRFISAEPLLGELAFFEDDCWLNLDGIDWLIVGGESGPNHRPMHIDWVRDLLDLASVSGTAFFFKQWGGATSKSGGRELDGRTWDEMPEVVR